MNKEKSKIENLKNQIKDLENADIPANEKQELKENLFNELSKIIKENYQNQAIINDGWIRATEDGNLSPFWYNVKTKTKLKKDGLPPKYEKSIEHWNSKSTKQYHLTFNPFEPNGGYQVDNYDYFNEYEGINIERIKGDVSLFENHIIKIWCNNNNELSDYILNWFASLIQRPGHKIQTALVVGGNEGTGKTIIVNKLIEILGNKYCSTITNNYALSDRFNGWLKNKLLVYFNEIEMSDRDMIGNLKGWITDSNITYHEKNKTEYVGTNYANFIFTSNADLLARINNDDRRYVITKTNDNHKCETDYFRQIAELPAGVIYDYLMSRDITNFDFNKIPDTIYKQELIELNYSDVKNWIEETGLNGIETLPDKKGFYNRSDVFDSFKSYTNHYSKNPNKFWQEMRKEGVVLEEKKAGGVRKVLLKIDTESSNDNKEGQQGQGAAEKKLENKEDVNNEMNKKYAAPCPALPLKKNSTLHKEVA